MWETGFDGMWKNRAGGWFGGHVEDRLLGDPMMLD